MTHSMLFSNAKHHRYHLLINNLFAWMSSVKIILIWLFGSGADSTEDFPVADSVMVSNIVRCKVSVLEKN